MEYHGFRSIKEYENECARVGFTTDETAQVLDGVINGHDANYLGKLSAHGYHPCKLQDAPAPAPAEPEYPVGEGGQICFLF